MYEFYPRPRFHTPDVIDVARWDAFRDGFVAAHVETEERLAAVEAERDEFEQKLPPGDHVVVHESRLRGADKRVRVLTEALKGAVEAMKDMRAYVPEEFAKRWKHDESIDEAEAALAVSSTENEEEQK